MEYTPVFTKRIINKFWQPFIKAYLSLLKLAPFTHFSVYYSVYRCGSGRNTELICLVRCRTRFPEMNLETFLNMFAFPFSLEML